MRRFVISLLAVLLFTGCAPWISIDKISTGMSKAEVVQHMGKPQSASGNGNQEYLWYTPVNRFWERYYVHLVDGKVQSYGPLGSEPEPAQ
jgi:uncharacterized protein YceK